MLTSHNLAVLAMTVAKRYWSAVPCAGQITVLTDMPLTPDLDPTTDGWVTFNLFAWAERPRSTSQHLHPMHHLTRPLAMADARSYTE